MSDVVYNRGKHRIASAGWPNLDVRCLLLGGSSVPAGCLDPDLNFVDALLAVSGAAELDATNYARKTCTGETATEDDTNDRVALTATVPTWSSLGGASNDTVRAVVFYEEGASDAARALLSIHELSPVVPTNGSDFTVSTSSDIIRVS